MRNGYPSRGFSYFILSASQRILWLGFVCVLAACAAEPPEEPALSTRVDYDMQVLAASRSGPEAAGRRLFAQRCALCHIGASTEVPYGGWLNAQFLRTIGEERARRGILEGTERMPAWKYSLQPAQVDQILAYLRTVQTDKKIDPHPEREAVIER